MPRFDVYIDGQGYMLDPYYGENAYAEEPQAPFKGKDREGPDFWQYWMMRDWHGGERQKVLVSARDLDNNQYRDAEGVTLDRFGEWGLQPALAQDVAIESGSMPMVVTTSGDRLILGLSVSPYIRIWYNGSWTSAASGLGTGTVTDLSVAGSSIYAVQNGKVYTSTDNGATWAEVKYQDQRVGIITVTSQGDAYTSPPDVAFDCEEGATAPTATAVLTDTKVTSVTILTKGSNFTKSPGVRFTGGGGFGATAVAALELATAASFSTATAVCRLNDNVCVGKSSGGVYNVTDSEPISTAGAVTSMVAYQGNLYWIEDCRLWCYEGKVPFVYDELPPGFNGAVLYVYRTVLLIIGWYHCQGGYRGAVHVLQGGSENHLYSVGNYSADHRVYAACGGDDEFWIANPDRGGPDRYDWTYGGLTCGPAWGSFSGIPYKSMAVVDGYLFVGRHDTVRAGTCQATGNDTTHTKLDTGASAANDYYNGMLLAHLTGTGAGQTATITDYDGTSKIATHSAVTTPANATTTFSVGAATNGVWKANLENPTAWRTSGWWESSEWDLEYSNDEKLLGEIRIFHRALTAGDSHLVEYSKDGGTTWVTAGTSSTLGATSKKFNFGTIKFDTLEIRVTTTGTGSTNPKGKKVVVRACAASEAKWRWTLRLICDRVASKSGRARSGFGAYDLLKTLADAQNTVTFLDRTGTAKTVVVEDCPITQSATSKRRAYPKVTLRQVA